MFRKETVIIVGAGGSAEFGLPTGAKIFSDLLSESQMQVQDSYNIYKDVFTTNFLTFLHYNNLHQYKDAFTQLIDRAENAVAESIDLLAYHHTDTLEVSKIYSVWKILGSMYSLDKSRTTDRSEIARPHYNWRRPRLNKKATWLSHVARKFLDGCTNVSDLEENRLTIVTFNYDTIIEDSLATMMRAQQRYAEIDDEAFPKVMHVYGQLPTLTNPIEPKTVHESSSLIKYIYEIEESKKGRDQQHLHHIKSAINDAERIFIAGFDMNERNVRLIRLNEAGGEKFALNYDGGPGLQNRLLAAGIDKSNVMSGTRRTPTSLSDACADGFFDLGNDDDPFFTFV